MVKELEKDGKTYYVCEVCGFTYKEKEWAHKCQEWCGENQSCNLDIGEHAVSLE